MFYSPTSSKTKNNSKIHKIHTDSSNLLYTKQWLDKIFKYLGITNLFAMFVWNPDKISGAHRTKSIFEAVVLSLARTLSLSLSFYLDISPFSFSLGFSLIFALSDNTHIHHFHSVLSSLLFLFVPLFSIAAMDNWICP